MASRGSGRTRDDMRVEGPNGSPMLNADAARQAPTRNLPTVVDPTETIRAVRESLEGREATLVAYLSKQDVSPERFVSTAIQAILQNRKLGLSTKSSLVYSILEAAQLGLEPTGILGGAWLVPYWSSKASAYEAKLIVGYRGYIDLFRRSGEVRSIEARVVYAGDLLEVEYGSEQRIRHIPYFLRGEESGDRIGVYWRAVLAGGIEQFDVVPISDVEKARKSSRAADGGPWVEWYDEMAKKTAIRRAVSTLPISVFGARQAVQLENEAEESAVVEPMPRGHGKETARDRAVALLDGSADGADDESAPPQDEAGREQAPQDGTPDTSSAEEEGRTGRPTASAAGSSSADAALEVDAPLPAKGADDDLGL